MTWGIIGLGNIGRRVADIAKMFGCHVIYYSTSGKNNQEGYERVDFDTLLTTSDIISVHAPLDANTQDLMERRSLCKNEEICDFLKSRTRTDRGGAGSGRCIEKTMRSQRQDWMCCVSSDRVQTTHSGEIKGQQ